MLEYSKVPRKAEKHLGDSSTQDSTIELLEGRVCRLSTARFSPRLQCRQGRFLTVLSCLASNGPKKGV